MRVIAFLITPDAISLLFEFLFVERRKTSVAFYGAASLVAILWITDWKAMCKYIPFYGSKYERIRKY